MLLHLTTQYRQSMMSFCSVILATFGVEHQRRTQAGGDDWCRNTLSAANNTPSPPQPRSNFVKHPLQNTENDCHQWLSGSFRVHQICFRPVAARTPLGELTALPQSL